LPHLYGQFSEADVWAMWTLASELPKGFPVCSFWEFCATSHHVFCKDSAASPLSPI